MSLKHILIVFPLLLIAALLQAIWWVPGYGEAANQSRRYLAFVEASSGDAKLLNPILNADTASSRIVELVFDGLIDLDEDLNLRGRLATSWQIDQTAELLVREGYFLPDGSKVTAQSLLTRLEAHLSAQPDIRTQLRGLDLLAPADQTVLVRTESGEQPFKVRLPARIEIHLSQVNQELDDRIAELVGPAYLAGFDASSHFEPATPETNEEQPGRPVTISNEAAEENLPILRHRPRIRFHLRRGVRFHDGEVFDAHDVVFTYRAIMQARNLSPRTSDFEPIERIAIIDSHTVDVVYKRLFAPAINAWTIGILPEHLLNDTAHAAELAKQKIAGEAAKGFGMRQYAFNRAPIGTGPFRFSEWRGDELIHLVRNRDYWDHPPEFEDYYYRVIPDPLTREIEFKTGAADTYAPLPHQAARYVRAQGYQSFSNPLMGYTYIGYNLRREPFDDARVRRALGMAIDTNQIITHVLYGEGERTTGPYPTTTPWYDSSVKPLPFDPIGASKLLAEAGWRKNADGWLAKQGKVLEFNLITNNGNAVRKSILAIAQDAWRGIGVKVNTQVFEWAVFLEDFINPAAFDAVVLGWRTGVDFDQYQIWHSSQTGRNQLNFVGYRSKTADELMVRLRKEYDPDKQRGLAHELHRLIAADQPYTFLFAPKVTRVLDPRILMRDKNGALVPIKVSKSGDIYIHMNRWTRPRHDG